MINMMRAVPSTHYQLLKYPTPSGMANIRSDQAMASNSPEEVQLGAKGLPSKF